MPARRIFASLGALFLAPAVILTSTQGTTSQVIARIENNLLPPVIVKGRALERTTLDDRMRELNVPGVSVAVFRNGRQGDRPARGR
jgi:hypothetical protein